VLGRRNWLFVGSDDGALANTTFVSLLASARLHDIEPHGYIRDLLCLIRTWPPDRLLELAPVNWKQTLEQAETQQKLLANFPMLMQVLRNLPDGLPDLHIGVVSSSMGAGPTADIAQCPPGGDGGRLQSAARIAGCAGSGESGAGLQ